MKVTDRVREAPNCPVLLCDFSPPRGGGASAADQARGIDADFICVAYNPGRAVRIDSAALALAIRTETGTDVCFNLSPRDMNKLALQSHLLGAEALGLGNVVVLAGDSLSQRDQQRMTTVNDFKVTELIDSIGRMNQGVDFRGSSLVQPTDFCIGASIDLSKGVEDEAKLAHRKAQAGADFFITQPVFSPDEVAAFNSAYLAIAGNGLEQPVFWGVQVVAQGGVMFSAIPQQIRDRLERGESGVDIALETLGSLKDAGIRTFYLVPPILRGGSRDYDSAKRVLTTARSWQT